MPPPSLPLHTRAVIISSGDEIILGQLLDTNARHIAQRLVDRGVVPAEHLTIPDDQPALVAALRRAAELAPLVIISGGLGPTDGDLTRAALAELTGDQLVIDEQARADISAMLTRRGREVTERQLRQACKPSRATGLLNQLGTAPGLHVIVQRAPSASSGGSMHIQTDIYALPGPPGELNPMLEAQVLPRLRLDPTRIVITRLCHIVGIPEADCVTKLGDLTKRTNMPLVGITASGGILTLRIRYEGNAPRDQAEQLINEIEQTARTKLGDHLFASNAVRDDRDSEASGAGETRLARGESPGKTPLDNESPRSGRHAPSTLAAQAQENSPGWQLLIRTILDHLIENKQTLAVAESCTGGLLGEMITSIPGSSQAFLGGFITYANALKQSLGVETTTLGQHGAVSQQTAEQMARRTLARTNADHAISITGIAGPDGGTQAKPVGTVYITLASRANHAAPASAFDLATSDTRRFLFTGDREDIRHRAAASALAMLYFHLKGHNPGTPKLLWEV